MPRRTQPKRAYHHGDLHRALLTTALELVAEQRGTSGLTLREVARRAGVSHAAPYRHYRDKRALLAAVAAEGFRELRAKVQRARARAGDDARARFIATGLAYFRFAHEHAAHFHVMYDVAKSDSVELQREANETFQVIKALAADARPNCSVLEARRLGVVVWSLAHGLALLAMNRQIPASLEMAPEDLVTLALDSLYASWRAVE